MNSKGFTIIELLVVVAIIAVLAAVVLVNVTGYIAKAKDAAIKADIGSLRTGMAACYAETGTYTNCYVATTGTTYVPATIESDITSQNGAGGSDLSVLITPTTGANYCASAELATSTGDNKYICADSTGTMVETTANGCDATNYNCTVETP